MGIERQLTFLDSLIRESEFPERLGWITVVIERLDFKIKEAWV